MAESSVSRSLLDSVVTYFRPRRVIVFGSRARGDAGPDSDTDLLVVLDDGAPPDKRGWRAAYEARRGHHEPVDIVVCLDSTYQRQRLIVGSLPNVAETEGIVVYDAA